MYRTANILSVQKQNTHEENLALAKDVQTLQSLVGGKLSVPLPIRIKSHPTGSLNHKIVRKGLAAREKLVTGNMRLVLHWMNKAKRIPKTEDYLQYGVMGLCNAAERFDPSRGYKFSTFAYWQVKAAFLCGLYGTSSIIKIPSGTLLNLKKRLASGQPLTPALLAAKDLLEKPTTFLDFSVPEIENYFLPGDSNAPNPDWELFLDNLDEDERALVEDVAIADETIEVAKSKRKWVNIESIGELSKDILDEPTREGRKPPTKEIKENAVINYYLPSDLVEFMEDLYQPSFVNGCGKTVVQHAVSPKELSWAEYKRAWARVVGVDFYSSKQLRKRYQQHFIDAEKTSA